MKTFQRLYTRENVLILAFAFIAAMTISVGSYYIGKWRGVEQFKQQAREEIERTIQEGAQDFVKEQQSINKEAAEMFNALRFGKEGD